MASRDRRLRPTLNRDPKYDPARIVLLGLISLALCATGFGCTVRNHYLEDAAAVWPSVEGRVVAATVVYDSSRSTSYDYRPVITYSYVVDGQSYSGDRIWLGDEAKMESRAEAQTFLADYPVGGSVTVYYDPGNPRRAALIRQAGKTWTWLIMGFGGLALLGVTLWMWRRVAVSRRTQVG